MNLPKVMSQEWLRELIDMTITARGNEFVIRRIEQEARVLLGKNAEQPEWCWLVLAFGAFLRGDKDGCVRAVDAAYALAKHDVMIVSNAASLLVNLGLPRHAVTYARRLVALSDGDLRQAVNAVNVFYAALRLEEAAGLLRKIEKHRLPGKDELRAADFDALSDSFRASHVDVELRTALLEASVRAIEAEGCSVRYAAPDLYPDYTLQYELYVDQPVIQCANLAFSIADALTEKFDDAFPELITFTCSPLASYRPTGVLIELAA